MYITGECMYTYYNTIIPLPPSHIYVYSLPIIITFNIHMYCTPAYIWRVLYYIITLILYSIWRGLESHDQVEVESAVIATDALCHQSRYDIIIVTCFNTCSCTVLCM